MDHFKALLGATALGTSLLSAGIAQAQSAPPVAQDSAQADQTKLEDIIVVAQRRGENLQKVPIVITAITADRLAATGATNSSDLAVLTPGLQVNIASGYIQPRIRGIGTSSFGPGIENPVATYVDGVYIASAPGSLLSLSGIERVEVLKGPQGTLFGRNSTGGVIQVITKDPSADFVGNADISYGNYQIATANAYFSGGTETAAIGVSGHYAMQGKGYGTNFFNGRDANRVDDDLALRAKLLLRPTDTTTVRISGDYSFLKAGYPTTRNLPNQPAPTLPNAPAGPFNVVGNDDTLRSTKSYGTSARIDQELGVANLVSITAYRASRFTSYFDLDRTAANTSHVDNTQTDKQFSQEIQLSSARRSPLTWTVGGFYFFANGSYAPGLTFTPGTFRINNTGSPVFIPQVRATTIGTQLTRSYSGFGQLSYEISPGFNLTGGLRYTTEKRSIDTSITRTRDSDRAFISTIALQNNATFNKLTWRAALDYLITPEVMGYVSYNRGFKSGGFNVTTPDVPTPYKPEVLDAYEIGVKSELFDRAVRFNAGGFYYNYQNVQVTFYPGAVGGTIGITNGSAAKVYGLDFDFEAVLAQGLRVFAGASVIHSEFGDFPNAVYNIPQPNGSNRSGPASSFGLNAKGNNLTYTSPFSGNIGFNYVFDALGGKIDVGSNLYYNGGYFPEVDNIRRQRSYVKLSASLGWTSQDGFSVRVWGKNLTDSVTFISTAGTAAGSGAAYETPRTYGVTLAKKF